MFFTLTTLGIIFVQAAMHFKYCVSKKVNVYGLYPERY